MLRITVNDDQGSTHFGVEGSLTQPSADELRKCWAKVCGPIPERKRLIVDLTALTNIDMAGKQILLEMYRHGVSLRGSGVMTRALIEEITHSG